jgi:hypothetical protein
MQPADSRANGSGLSNADANSTRRNEIIRLRNHDHEIDFTVIHTPLTFQYYGDGVENLI